MSKLITICTRACHISSGIPYCSSKQSQSECYMPDKTVYQMQGPYFKMTCIFSTGSLYISISVNLQLDAKKKRKKDVTENHVAMPCICIYKACFICLMCFTVDFICLNLRSLLAHIGRHLYVSVISLAGNVFLGLSLV